MGIVSGTFETTESIPTFISEESQKKREKKQAKLYTMKLWPWSSQTWRRKYPGTGRTEDAKQDNPKQTYTKTYHNESVKS